MFGVLIQTKNTQSIVFNLKIFIYFVYIIKVKNQGRLGSTRQAGHASGVFTTTKNTLLREKQPL